MLTDILIIALQLVGCLLIADLIAGFFHWLEDSYDVSGVPVVGRSIAEPNVLHHYDPAHFAQHPYLVNVRSSALIAIACVGIAAALGGMSWQLAAVAFAGANGNEVHKWAHRPARHNGRLITALQRTGLLQSARHHAVHHSGGRDGAYCVMTGYLNPVLDRLRFWRALEWAIWRVSGASKRPDHSLDPVTRRLHRPQCTRRQCQEAHAATAARMAARAA